MSDVLPPPLSHRRYAATTKVQDDGQVLLSVAEFNRHLSTRAEAAQAVAVAGTAVLILVAEWLNFRWAAHGLLVLALVRLAARWWAEKRRSTGPQ